MHRINFPTKIYIAPGLLAELGQIPELRQPHFGRPALLVTDQGLARTDIPTRTVAAFAGLGVSCSLFDRVLTNPDDAVVEAGVLAYREAGAEWIIGLGGGSAIDVAKTIAVRLNHPGPLQNYDDLVGGDALFTGPIPDVVAIPTTAGTGSEVSRSSVIHIEAVDRKVVIFSPRMMPALALLDPELTVGLPPAISAFTGLDALTHLLEAYVATGYHPIADGVALEGIRLVFENLPKVLANPGDLSAREAMLMASLMGAVAFQKGLGAAHSMAHPLSSVCGLHHGQANAVVLRTVTEFNREAIGSHRFGRLAFAATGGKGDSYDAFMAALTELTGLCSIPPSLLPVGVQTQQVPRLAALALSDGCHQTNPRSVTEENFRDLFLALL